MPHRLEIALRPDLYDAHGDGIRKKALDYFGIQADQIRVARICVLDMDLSPKELEAIQTQIFTNPVTQVSSYHPLALDFDWIIWVGFRPGVRDNPGATAMEAIEDLLGRKPEEAEAVYTSCRYCVKGGHLDKQAMDRIAGELLANDIIQQWRVYSADEWDPANGVGMIIPKVRLDHVPKVAFFGMESDETLARLSQERNLALHPADIPFVRAYYLDPEVQRLRREKGLSDPTDIELEYICQARSDHCNHNTFQGLFRYRESEFAPVQIMDNLFKTCVKEPTLALKEEKPWVVSVLWDNAGVARFDPDNNYVITGETHNSPSNMEAYGGAITGIVGVYRDPMGTGKGARLIMGGYGYCVGPRDYNGPLKPHLHPRRLLDGVIEGVRDGGNKSGIPTAFGQVMFHPGYLGKCLVFVTALGMMPAMVNGESSAEKTTSPGELIVMCGGRIGKDGIHGVTASSESFSEHTPAGHVQIGDPYTQKKMHDFLLEARDMGLVSFITDNGGGGLSSSVGESALFSNGCEVELEKAPLKYQGLDQWEIWVSESQERMTVAVAPGHIDAFMDLAAKHEVEATVIGRYTDTGKLHITYEGKTCAYVDLSLLTGGFPQWEFDAVWAPPESRGLFEPVLKTPSDYNALMLDLLARPNICSKEWVVRQYDHEVQGTSVIKPLVGAEKDVPSDAAVMRPVLESEKGLVFSQSLIPQYSAIDAYHMTACVIDEAVRRLLAVGGDPDHMGGVDNFCWPNIGFDPRDNPDGKFKAAQLVRSCLALKDMCLAFKIPLLSGKDSMYVDGHLKGAYGETHKVSSIGTLQFSATSVTDDVTKCVTMDAKCPGDLVYVLGVTKDELGASEYYEHFGYVGRNVPQVDPAAFLPLYQALATAVSQERVSLVHGVYRGGLAIHLALCAMAGNLGMEVDLSRVPATEGAGDDPVRMFSESAGRFIVTVPPENQSEFEALFDQLPLAKVGTVTDSPELVITGQGNQELVRLLVKDMKTPGKNRLEH